MKSDPAGVQGQREIRAQRVRSSKIHKGKAHHPPPCLQSCPQPQAHLQPSHPSHSAHRRRDPQRGSWACLFFLRPSLATRLSQEGARQGWELRSATGKARAQGGRPSPGSWKEQREEQGTGVPTGGAKLGSEGWGRGGGAGQAQLARAPQHRVSCRGFSNPQAPPLTSPCQLASSRTPQGKLPKEEEGEAAGLLGKVSW